ncbi:MAG: DUF6150 family protein [Acidobacteriota bacterium]
MSSTIKFGVLISIILIFSGFCLFGNNIYITKYKSDADAVIYISKYKSDAHLVVYISEYKSDSTGDESIWYYTKYKSDADAKLYISEYKSDSDIIVYFTEYKSDAGWKRDNDHKGKL